jgi:hypothetical protein
VRVIISQVWTLGTVATVALLIMVFLLTVGCY